MMHVTLKNWLCSNFLRFIFLVECLSNVQWIVRRSVAESYQCAIVPCEGICKDGYNFLKGNISLCTSEGFHNMSLEMLFNNF